MISLLELFLFGKILPPWSWQAERPLPTYCVEKVVAVQSRMMANRSNRR
jgi:hypothetical protein